MAKIVLFGYGYWGKIWEKTIKNSEYELYKIIDPFVFNNNINDLDFNEFEYAVIATPVNHHYETAKKLLEQNKKVLIEKPGTDSLEKIQELNEINDRNSMIGYVLVYLDCLKDIPNINWTQAQFYRSNGSVKRIDCNVIYDLLCHDIALAYHLFGVIPEVKFVKFDFDNANCVLQFGDTLATFYCSRSDPVKQSRFVLLTNEINYEYDDVTKKGILTNKNKEIKDYPGYPLQNELKALINKNTKTDLNFGIVIQKILYEISNFVLI